MAQFEQPPASLAVGDGEPFSVPKPEELDVILQSMLAQIQRQSDEQKDMVAQAFFACYDEPEWDGPETGSPHPPRHRSYRR